MSQNANNRQRALAEVVSLEAWHDEFSATALKAALHVDVVFETGRIGGEEDSPVRFRLNIKQADVVVVVPESEPIGVDKNSVSRDAPQVLGGIAAAIELAPDGSVELTNAASELRMINVTQSTTPDGEYRWSLRPCQGNVLHGRPWDPIESPHLRLIDRRKDRSKGIPPAVRVEIRCRREDLTISDIDIKNASILEKAKSKIGYTNRLAAAEAYIRDRLAKEGLEVKNFKDSFGEIHLASTLADPQ